MCPNLRLDLEEEPCELVQDTKSLKSKHRLLISGSNTPVFIFSGGGLQPIDVIAPATRSMSRNGLLVYCKDC